MTALIKPPTLRWRCKAGHSGEIDGSVAEEAAFHLQLAAEPSLVGAVAECPMGGCTATAAGKTVWPDGSNRKPQKDFRAGLERARRDAPFQPPPSTPPPTK